MKTGALAALALILAACSSASSGGGPAGLPHPMPCEPEPWTIDEAPRFETGPERSVVYVDSVPVAAPGLLNPTEVQVALQRAYAPLIPRSASIPLPIGTAYFWLYVDATGNVADRQLERSTGHEELDRAASKVVDAMALRPAFRQGCSASSWTLWPITFRFFRINGVGAGRDR